MDVVKTGLLVALYILFEAAYSASLPAPYSQEVARTVHPLTKDDLTLLFLVSLQCIQCRETRYFSTWKRRRQHEDHYLPDVIRKAARSSQRSVPFGDAVLAFEDCVLGVETCEELFTPAAPHINLALSGVEIISNSSGSHHQVSPYSGH